MKIDKGEKKGKRPEKNDQKSSTGQRQEGTQRRENYTGRGKSLLLTKAKGEAGKSHQKI